MRGACVFLISKDLSMSPKSVSTYRSSHPGEGAMPQQRRDHPLRRQ